MRVCAAAAMRRQSSKSLRAQERPKRGGLRQGRYGGGDWSRSKPNQTKQTHKAHGPRATGDKPGPSNTGRGVVAWMLADDATVKRHTAVAVEGQRAGRTDPGARSRLTATVTPLDEAALTPFSEGAAANARGCEL